MSKQLVIASNYRQFIEYCRQTDTNPSECKFVSSDYDLHGYASGTKVIWCEPWFWQGNPSPLAAICRARQYDVEYFTT